MSGSTERIGEFTVPQPPDFEAVGIIGEDRTLIGEADVYRRPGMMDPVSWAQALDRHISEKTASCIAMVLDNDRMIRISRKHLQRIAEQDTQRKMANIMGLAFRTSRASLVMLTRDRRSSSV